MAKTSGSLRASFHEGNPYHIGTERHEYADLSPAQKRTVINLKNTYAKGMIKRLRDKKVILEADGKKIEVGFNARGLEHVAQDAMIKLSGKYFSKNSLYRIDEILAKSTYIPSSHILYKDRKDGIVLFYKYQDNEGRGAYTPLLLH